MGRTYPRRRHRRRPPLAVPRRAPCSLALIVAARRSIYSALLALSFTPLRPEEVDAHPDGRLMEQGAGRGLHRTEKTYHLPSTILHFSFSRTLLRWPLTRNMLCYGFWVMGSGFWVLGSSRTS